VSRHPPACLGVACPSDACRMLAGHGCVNYRGVGCAPHAVRQQAWEAHLTAAHFEALKNADAREAQERTAHNLSVRAERERQLTWTQENLFGSAQPHDPNRTYCGRAGR